nr:MAG TPA: hypothetical protein [Caudoviricetes sp.]
MLTSYYMKIFHVSSVYLKIFRIFSKKIKLYLKIHNVDVILFSKRGLL